MAKVELKKPVVDEIICKSGRCSWLLFWLTTAESDR